VAGGELGGERVESSSSEQKQGPLSRVVAGGVEVGSDHDSRARPCGRDERGDVVTGGGGSARCETDASAVCACGDGDGVQRAFYEDDAGAAREECACLEAAVEVLVLAVERCLGLFTYFGVVVSAPGAARPMKAMTSPVSLQRQHESVAEPVNELAVAGTHDESSCEEHAFRDPGSAQASGECVPTPWGVADAPRWIQRRLEAAFAEVLRYP
jgi:hypothetical protein